MNYLMIIIVLAIVGLYIFFSREIDVIKKDIDDKLTHISTSLNSTTKIFQSDLGACVKKIKAMNGEYVEQVRKMNDYGSQPITNISNHYTDCDSADGQNPINYLSDTNTKNNSKKEHSFYMSEDNNKFKIVYSDKPEPSRDTKLIVSNDSKSTGSESSEESSDMSDGSDRSDRSTNSGEPSIKSSNKSTKPSDPIVTTVAIAAAAAEAHTDNDTASADTDDSKLSAATIDIKHLSTGTFRPVEKCTYEYLKKISKIYGIPLRVTEGKKTRQLKKDELHQRIKSYLEEHK